MASVKARIGVTKDPELQAALEMTRALLASTDTRSEAGHVRRLALLGAKALGAGAGELASDRARILKRPGVRPAVSRAVDLSWLSEDETDAQRDASRALDWVRGES